MNGTDFEGYNGIGLNQATFSNDCLLVVVLILLSLFALIFRLNVPLFGRMVGNMNAGKQRNILFNKTDKDNFLFNAFMTFQAIVLSSIFLFTTILDFKLLQPPTFKATLIYLGIIILALFIFYLFKVSLYRIFINIFTDEESREMFFKNYHGIFGFWGVILYIPVLWTLLIGENFHIPYIAYIISYLIFRLFLAYRFFYIFLNKNTGILFFSLYLCGQEIVPLVLLFEGLVYLYNVIENTIVWL